MVQLGSDLVPLGSRRRHFQFWIATRLVPCLVPFGSRQQQIPLLIANRLAAFLEHEKDKGGEGGMGEGRKGGGKGGSNGEVNQNLS